LHGTEEAAAQCEGESAMGTNTTPMPDCPSSGNSKQHLSLLFKKKAAPSLRMPCYFQHRNDIFMQFASSME
jgi:hypothetical protein